MLFNHMPHDEEKEARIAELLKCHAMGDPPWPLPNMKRVTESDYWGWCQSYSFNSDVWAGSRQIVDQHGKKRWATIRVYYVGHSQFIDGGFAVAIYYAQYRGLYPTGSYVNDVEYFEWRACAHDFKQTNIGNCLNRYTCVHCRKYYDVDSSG